MIKKITILLLIFCTTQNHGYLNIMTYLHEMKENLGEKILRKFFLFASADEAKSTETSPSYEIYVKKFEKNRTNFIQYHKKIMSPQKFFDALIKEKPLDYNNCYLMIFNKIKHLDSQGKRFNQQDLMLSIQHHDDIIDKLYNSLISLIYECKNTFPQKEYMTQIDKLEEILLSDHPSCLEILNSLEIFWEFNEIPKKTTTMTETNLSQIEKLSKVVQAIVNYPIKIQENVENLYLKECIEKDYFHELYPDYLQKYYLERPQAAIPNKKS